MSGPPRTNGTPEIDRLPPHMPEMEGGVIGCALLSPNEVLPQLVERRYHPKWNYDLRHVTIATALLTMFEAGRPVDLLSLHHELQSNGTLDQVGGLAFLNQLQECVPSASNWPYYFDTVRDLWKLRQIIAFATAVRTDAFNHTGPLEPFLARAQSQMEDLLSPLQTASERHIREVLANDVIPNIEKHYNRGSTQLDGLPTGQDWYLDKVLLGIANTDYMVLAGRPGEGKTSLALNIVDYLATRYRWQEETDEAGAKKMREAGLEVTCARKGNDPEKWFIEHTGIPIGIFTLEMTEDALGFRLVFGHAKVSSGSFRQGYAKEDAWAKVTAASAELCKANIYLDGEPDQNMDVIAAKARRMAKQHGIKLFVLDYLQLLDSDNDNDRLRVLRRISKKIVSLKKRLQVPWLVLAQLNRNIETAERARRPVLSDLKESGSIEQDADKIAILYHPLKAEGIEEDEEKIDRALQAKYGDKAVPWDEVPRRINVLVAKNRNGPTGPAAMLFQNNQCLFHCWRQWQVAHGLEKYAAGESKSRNPEEQSRAEELRNLSNEELELPERKGDA